jgi:hypothetical protein
MKSASLRTYPQAGVCERSYSGKCNAVNALSHAFSPFPSSTVSPLPLIDLARALHVQGLREGARRSSTRPYKGLPDIDYPFHDKTIVVTNCDRICLGQKKINFSTVFAGQAVGIKEVHDDIWLVSLMDYDLGYFDLETRVLEPLENPFGPKVLPMS